MKGPLSAHGAEGPVYADRVNGRLTFSDWDSWNDEDRSKWDMIRRQKVINDAHDKIIELSRTEYSVKR